MPTAILQPSKSQSAPKWMRELPDWVHELGNMLGPDALAGVVISEPGKVFHGTRSAFDFFKPRKYGHPSQPANEFVHAAFDPEDAKKVALEARQEMAGLGRGGHHVGADPNSPVDQTGLNIIPIQVNKGDEFLNLAHTVGDDFRKLKPVVDHRLEAAKRLKAFNESKGNFSPGTARKAEKLEQLKRRIEGSQYVDWLGPGYLQPEDLDPSIVRKAGFRGVMYNDLGKPAVMFPETSRLTTPWGTPLTQVGRGLGGQ